ncbi:MAG: hypothetical protein U0K68_13480 [Agathobacter sp.]|nr:hypothetical protein [Agathobacter sp.]
MKNSKIKSLILAGVLAVTTIITPLSVSALPLSDKAQAESTAIVQAKKKVVTAYSKSGSYTDSLGNKVKYSYKLPKFNYNTKAAKELNKKIKNKLIPIINEELKNIKDGCSLVCTNISYKYYSKKDVVSICIQADTDWDYSDYYTFSYNYKTAKAVTNKQLIKKAGLTEKKLVKLAKQKCDIYVPAKKTVTQVVLSSQMYINNKGKLVVILPVKSQAGAEFYYHKYTF